MPNNFGCFDNPASARGGLSVFIFYYSRENQRSTLILIIKNPGKSLSADRQAFNPWHPCSYSLDFDAFALLTERVHLKLS
jgi:hypothetical protein